MANPNPQDEHLATVAEHDHLKLKIGQFYKKILFLLKLMADLSCFIKNFDLSHASIPFALVWLSNNRPKIAKIGQK